MSKWIDIIDKDIEVLGVMVSIYANDEQELAIDIRDIETGEVLGGRYFNVKEIKRMAANDARTILPSRQEHEIK